MFRTIENENVVQWGRSYLFAKSASLVSSAMAAGNEAGHSSWSRGYVRVLVGLFRPNSSKCAGVSLLSGPRDWFTQKALSHLQKAKPKEYFDDYHCANRSPQNRCRLF